MNWTEWAGLVELVVQKLCSTSLQREWVSFGKGFESQEFNQRKARARAREEKKELFSGIAMSLILRLFYQISTFCCFLSLHLRIFIRDISKHDLRVLFSQTVSFLDSKVDKSGSPNLPTRRAKERERCPRIWYKRERGRKKERVESVSHSHLNWTLLCGVWAAAGPSDCDTLILGSLSCNDDCKKFLVKSSSFDSARLYSLTVLTALPVSSCDDWCCGGTWWLVLAFKKATWASVEQMLSSGVLICSDSLSLVAMDLESKAFEKRRPLRFAFLFDWMWGLSALTDLVLILILV